MISFPLCSFIIDIWFSIFIFRKTCSYTSYVFLYTYSECIRNRVNAHSLLVESITRWIKEDFFLIKLLPSTNKNIKFVPKQRNIYKNVYDGRRRTGSTNKIVYFVKDQIRKNKNEKFRIGRFHHSAVPVLTNRINSRSIPRTKGTKNGTILIGRSRNRAAAKTRTVHWLPAIFPARPVVNNVSVINERTAAWR